MYRTNSMTFIDKVANLVFRCWHRRLSLPMTLPRSPEQPKDRPAGYVVCLDCGKRFSYDLERLVKGPPLDDEITR